MAKQHARAGFTLAEVIVSTAIVVMLAAATAPSFMSYLDEQRAQSAANTLQAIQMGIVNGTNQGFFNLVDSAGTTKNYPGLLHDLANPLVAAVATDHNSCGSVAARRYTTTDVTTWNSNGPFVTFAIATNNANAVTTPIGILQDSIVRESLSGTTYLSIRILKVLNDDVLTLKQIVDGSHATPPDSLNGSIRWIDDATSGFKDVKFEIPVNSTRC